MSLHNYSFSGLSALKYLSIKDTFSIHHLPEEVFKPLNTLEELHLEALCNPFVPFGFDCTTIDKRLKHVPSLKKIFIDKKIIQSIEKGFLSLEKNGGPVSCYKRVYSKL